VRLRGWPRPSSRSTVSRGRAGWAEAPDPRPRAAGGRRPVRRDDERLADILEAVIDVPQLASQVLAIQSGRAAD